MSAGFKDNRKKYNENKIVTSHAKTSLVVCGFQRIAICMPCISHSNRLGGPIVWTVWAIRAKKNCIRLHRMVSHHLIASVQKFPSVVRHVSVWLHPCKNFLHPCIRLTAVMQNFSSSVHPFGCSVLNCLALRFSSVCLPCICLPFVHSEGTFLWERSQFT